jgi:pyruvate-formate lyase-activating enzyme
MQSLLKYKNYSRLWRVYARSVLRYGTLKKTINALQTEWAYRRRKVAVKSRPYVLFIEPLYYCNLACPLCDRELFPDAREADQRKLPLEVFDGLLDELGDYLFHCHIFGVGEPLLDWGLTRQVIEKAHARRIFTLVSTNATLITEKMAQEIVSSGLDHIVCAIDGVSQAAYGAYRVGGKAAEAIGGLRLLAAAKRRANSSITIEWQFIVNRFNAGEMDQARQIAKEIGVVVRFAPLGGIEQEKDMQEHWLPSDPAWREAGVSGTKSRYEWPCYWLWRGVVVNSNAHVVRCPGFHTVTDIGALQTSTAMEIVDGPSSRRSRELFVRGPVEEGAFPEPCNTCSFYPRHHGGPAVAKSVAIAAMEAAKAGSAAREFESAGFVPSHAVGIRRVLVADLAAKPD